jgi:hypothetical protein
MAGLPAVVACHATLVVAAFRADVILRAEAIRTTGLCAGVAELGMTDSATSFLLRTVTLDMASLMTLMAELIAPIHSITTNRLAFNLFAHVWIHTS